MRRTELGGQSEVSSTSSFFLSRYCQVLGYSGPQEGRLWEEDFCWQIRLRRFIYSSCPCLELTRFSSIDQASFSGLDFLQWTHPILHNSMKLSHPLPVHSANCQRLCTPASACLPDHTFHCNLLAPGPTPVQPTGQSSSQVDADLANGVIFLPLTLSTEWEKWLYLHPIEAHLKPFPRIPVSINGTFSLNALPKDVFKSNPFCSHHAPSQLHSTFVLVTLWNRPRWKAEIYKGIIKEF